MTYNELITAIESAIKTNGNQEITAQILQDVLVQMTETEQSNIEAIDIPTLVSELTNDAGYQNASEVASAIASAIASKANQSDVDQLDQDVAALGTAVAGKASQNDLDALEGTVSTMQTTLAGKADAADIPTVPTNVSAFTNDSGYQNATQVSNAISAAIASKANTSTVEALDAELEQFKTATTMALAGKADTSDIPTVPTVVSAFTNDSGYQTASQVATAISEATADLPTDSTVSAIQTTLTNLISGGESGKIDNFNEIVAFLDGIPETEAGTLYEILTSLQQSIPTTTSQLTNNSGYQTGSQVSSAISTAIADKADSATYATQSGVTSATIQPNTFTDFGTVTALTITLGSVASDATLEERMFGFQFTSGTTATTLTMPSTVKFPEDPTIEAGYTYQVTILNNLALISGWPNS